MRVARPVPLLTPPVVANLMTSAPRSIWRRTTLRQLSTPSHRLSGLGQMRDEVVVEPAAPVHMAAGGRDRAARVDDPRPLHLAALDRVAQRQRGALSSPRLRTVVKPARASSCRSSAPRAHASAAPRGRTDSRPASPPRSLSEMDVAVDQAGEHGLVAEVDQRRARPAAATARRDRDDAAAVDDDRRRPAHRLPGHRDQPAGMDVGRRGAAAAARRKPVRPA